MKTTLRTLLIAALSLATPAVLPLVAASKPNVIIVLTDDQGYGDLSCHGNPVLKTPNLDRLHSESIRLTDFHVTPMCTPTRGQLLSGLDCLRNGAMNVSSGCTLLRQGILTMADIFAASGYRTGQFGKWHLGDNYPYRPQDRGFQESVWFPSSHIPSAPDHWNNDYFDDTYRHNGKPQAYKGYCTDVFFSEAMKWMKGCADLRQPFFTYLALNAAHAPLFVPPQYRSLYPGQKRNVASFFGMIANIDENMDRLEAFLRESGLRDNTLLIFMTDNGGTAGVPVFNAGMKGGKVTLWEGGHRVPCFIRWPNGKLRAPGDVAELTQVQDILPTLIELCGMETVAVSLGTRPPTEGLRLKSLTGKKRAAWKWEAVWSDGTVTPASFPRFDGISLAGLLRGETNALPDRMLVVQFSRMNHPQPEKGDAAVLWQRWRLVQDKELYDLKTDFGQKTNVIAQHPDVVARMRAHYEQWSYGVAPMANEFSAIHLGSDQENPSLLSPCEWQDVFLDQSAQVRRGERKNGVWNVFVARAGEYEISLRRWPVEADAAISAGVPEYKAADGVYPAGVALPITKARLKVADFDQSTPVGTEDKAAMFTAKLKPGRTQLQTWFYDAEDKELCGAYYVYVKRK